MKIFFQFLNKSKMFVYLAFVSLGIIFSLSIAWPSISVQSDLCDSVMLWFGWHAFGWSFFKSWLYTPDNWLFTVIPVHFLLFSLMGVTPVAVWLYGYIIFILNIFMLSMIALTLQCKKTALFLPFIFLFFSYHNIDTDAFVFSLTHNSTDFYGLFALWCGLKWLESPAIKYLFLVGLLSILAGLSDPWFYAAYLYPLIISSSILLVYFLFYSRQKLFLKHLGIVITALFSLLFIKTKLFHLVHFLPKLHFQFADSAHLIHHNIYTFFKIVSVNFNLFPINTPHFLHVLVNNVIFWSLSLFSLLLLFRQYLTTKSTTILYFAVFSIFSISVMTLPFMLGSTYQSLIGRYLLNIICLVPLIIAISIELSAEFLPSWLKCSLLIAALWYIGLSIYSSVPNLKITPYNNLQKPTLDLISFLEAHHLTHGYGAYWSSYAYSVTWLSQYKILMYPITFSTNEQGITIGTRAQTSKLWHWFSPSQPFFIYLTNDRDECHNDIKYCAQLVYRQFGKPDQILHYQNNFIYVWNKDRQSIT